MIPKKIKEIEREIDEEVRQSHIEGFPLEMNTEYWIKISKIELLKELSSEIEKEIDELSLEAGERGMLISEIFLDKLKQKLLGGKDE